MKNQYVVILAAAAALTTASSSAATLTVATYGGEWGDAIRICVLEPFTKATSNQIAPEPGVSGVTLAKLRQQAGNPSIDVAWLDGGVSESAADNNLLAPLEKSTIPNLEKIVSQGLYKTNKGNVYAVSTGFYAIGLVYNSAKVKTPPTSWEDLWNTTYHGLATLPSPGNAMGIPFLFAINSMNGGAAVDVNPGLQKIKQMQPYSYFDTSGNATNSFQSGEVVIGAHYASAAWALSDKGFPVTYVVPKEGALGGDIRLHMTKGTKNAKIAQEFINFAIATEQATCMSNRLYIAPATTGVKLSDRAKQRMPWGPNGSIENLKITDWKTVNQYRSAISDQWNKAISR